ncbi:permease-like cell division protein FtsX [Nocardia sp. NBC_00565]|uniref:permease-like cell division protein FtsX n=1 Tax=Nocardia sp. NBC_00565 TaxID=2975993 RepID=UPI002E802D48|nr:permease-like cell division protein FtsX [Nocardia sp. NBC_00565]WUC00420.1 permease-like cell division protein FtsX [Nocardia sp. NBC_00565]
MRLGFLFDEVFTGLRRNVTMTIAMILTTAVSLTMLGGGLLALRIADKTQDYFMDRVEIRLYLTDLVSATDTDCSEQPCQLLMSDLKKTDGVVSVQFINSDEAMQEATEVTFKDQPEMLDMIKDTRLPASLRVKMTDADQYPRIYQTFRDKPGIQSVLNDKDTVDRLVGVFDGLRNAAFGLAGLQALAALLLIANMVQIAAFSRREEVGIMRMVGATRWYTQLPFLLEAVVAALAGSVLAVVGLFLAQPLVVNRGLGALFNSNVFPHITNEDIALVSLTIAPLGIVFAAITAYGTLRYYVRD